MGESTAIPAKYTRHSTSSHHSKSVEHMCFFTSTLPICLYLKVNSFFFHRIINYKTDSIGLLLYTKRYEGDLVDVLYDLGFSAL